jgi:hypothetical protein
MKRVAYWLLIGVPVAALVVWIARNTEWVDTKVPMPLKGEARTNPFYAAQRFANELGARASRDRVLTVPPANGVLVLSGWHWGLTTARRATVQRWVESGGRLVIDRTVAIGEDEFERWSGIERTFKRDVDTSEETSADEDSTPAEPVDPCRSFEQESDQATSTSDPPTFYTVCGAGMISSLTTDKTVEWLLRDDTGIQAMRVRVGEGSVAAINATPFRYRDFLDGHHPWVFAAAAQLRRGDEVRFLTEDDHPSLVALLWQHGAPVVVLSLAIAGLALWRGSIRFGPLAAVPQGARRSLAEQIRGTGQFALRHGSGEALHAAMVRALEDVGHRRISGYARLDPTERAEALSRLTGFTAESIADAIGHSRVRRPHELRNTIAQLETARRQTLHEQTRAGHGTS